MLNNLDNERAASRRQRADRKLAQKLAQYVFRAAGGYACGGLLEPELLQSFNHLARSGHHFWKDAVQHQQRTGCAHQAARTGCGRPAGELHSAEGLMSNQSALALFLLLLRPCRPAFTLSCFEFKEHGFPQPANLPWTKKAGKNGPTLLWTTHHCLHRPLDLLFSCLPRPPLFFPPTTALDTLQFKN